MPVTNKLRTEVTANWDRHPKVEGRILRIDSQEIDGPKGVEIVPYLLVDDKDRFVRVYKSAALEEAFAVAKVGDFISVESIGMRLTKSQRQCRQFDVRVWADSDAAPVVESKVATRRGPVAEQDETEAAGVTRPPKSRKR